MKVMEIFFTVSIVVANFTLLWLVSRTSYSEHRLMNGNLMRIETSWRGTKYYIDMEDPQTRENFRKALERFKEYKTCP